MTRELSDDVDEQQLTFDNLRDRLALGEGDQISVCHSPAGNGAPFRATVVNADDADAEVARHPDDNVYFGVNPVAGITPGARGTVAQVTRLVAFVPDLDLKHDGGMPSIDAINLVIGDLSDILGIEPVAVTNSGHGGQPYWAFDRTDPAVRLADGDNRINAMAACRRLGRLVREIAQRHGGDADTTFDLTRVWRVPNTLNVKDPDNPVPVTTVAGPGPGCRPDPDREAPLTVDGLNDILDSYGVRTYAEDRELLGDVVADPGDWRWGRTCHYVAAMIAGWKGEGPKKKIGRHPSLLARAVRLAAAHRLGCITEADYNTTVERVAAQFTSWCENGVYGEQRNVAPGEISDIFGWAVTKVSTMDDARVRKELDGRDGPGHQHTTPDSREGILHAAGDTPAAPTAGTSSTPAAEKPNLAPLWERKSLQQLQQFARSRRVAPLAMLGAVLARVLACVPAAYVVPPIVGGQNPLNFIVALVGPSGVGKDAANAAAAAWLDLTGWRDSCAETGKSVVPVCNLGSGEGIGHEYAHYDKDNGMVRDRESVLWTCSEIDTLMALGARQGATLMPRLRDAWSGLPLGFSYVDKAKKLKVPANTYRFTLIAGVQPERAGELLAQAAGGTPQRIVWLPTLDAEAPDVRPAAPPKWRVTTLASRRITDPKDIIVCEEAWQELDALQTAKVRGRAQLDPLDGHAGQVRLRLAAGLAALEGHLGTDGVTLDDWVLAELVMQISDATRAGMIGTLRQQAAASNRARGHADAERDVAKTEVVEKALIPQVAKAVLIFLRKQPPGRWIPRGDLRRAIDSKIRGGFDGALTMLEATGQIESEPIEYHKRLSVQYRIKS